MKVLANKVLAFNNGELNSKGELVEYKTKVGFCELPDWVAQTEYFKLATLDGSIKAFESTTDKAMEEAKKKDEEIERLKAEIEALKGVKTVKTEEVKEIEEEVTAKKPKK